MSVLDTVPTQRSVEPLTRRERVVLAELDEDTTLEQIATRLFVTRNTVKSQVRSVYRKLGVSTRADAVEAARPHARSLGVELALRTVDVPPVPGDADRLGQVVDNLITNAVKFTPPGGRVLVRVRREGERAVLEVADTGVGIPAGEVGRLFERFFRASTATEQQIPGIGLGLSISRAIVEAHGGDIVVASIEGHGTTFRVELPLAPALVTAAV